MQKIIKGLAVIAAIMLAKIVPFNWIVGSEYATFSWTSVCAPVIAMHAGFAWISCFFISFKSLTVSALSLLLLHRLPLVLSARTFTHHTMWTSVLVPILCMMLFVLHPVGGQAWLYAMYWLLPMVLWFASKSIVSRALQASFVAHAVGSVVWLYTGSISAQVWLSLIPLVAVERLAIAVGIVVCNEIVAQLVHVVTYVYKKQVSTKALS